jgi:hypothetical protein
MHARPHLPALAAAAAAALLAGCGGGDAGVELADVQVRQLGPGAGRCLYVWLTVANARDEPVELDDVELDVSLPGGATERAERFTEACPDDFDVASLGPGERDRGLAGFDAPVRGSRPRELVVTLARAATGEPITLRHRFRREE